MAVTCDPEHKFELALQLSDLKIAYQLANETEVVFNYSFNYLLIVLCSEVLWLLTKRQLLVGYEFPDWSAYG